MRSSADLIAAADAPPHLADLARAHGPRAVVLIDGRSGAGKTTLARAMAALWPASVLHLDSVYPGWDGLRAGSDAVVEGVLAPRRAAKEGEWREWDWTAQRPGPTHPAPDLERGLIVEGAGILTPRSAALADLRVWVEAPDEVRRQRALARDGDAYRPHWERWARQEADHLRRSAPQALADVIVTAG